MSLWIIFLTGLTTGGLSCVALQGGLLASVIATQKAGDKKLSATSFSIDWWPVASFLVSKLIAHVIVGFLLGWLGSYLQLSVPVRLFFQTMAALFMVATAANLLQLHPLFRYVVIQPPKFVQRWVRHSSRGQTVFAPAVLGALTVLIPCGVTQAMEVLAITSGNPFVGAGIMAAFVLGTMPLFAAVGVLTASLSDSFQQTFMKVAAVLLVALAVVNLNGVLVVMGSPFTLGSITKPVEYFFSSERFNSVNETESNGEVQQRTITVGSHGYSPKKLQVKAGQPVELTLVSQDAYSCASEFMLPAFDILVRLKPNDRQTVRFTPMKPGTFTYTCSMGMYTGSLEVR